MISRLILGIGIVHLVLICFVVGLSLLILSIIFPKLRVFANRFISEIPRFLTSVSNRRYKRYNRKYKRR